MASVRLRLELPLVLGCFFLSGVAGLVYETAWTQQFAFVFGASEPAIAAVLAAYMAGLTLGALVGGRWSARVRRPILAYALLEAGVALSALLVPRAVVAAAALQESLFGGRMAPPESSGAVALFHWATAFLVLGVPTLLMGATLPILVRQLVSGRREIARRTGLLYAVNTIGATAGALLCAFVLLPTFGLRGATVSGVLLSLLACLLLLPLAMADRGRRSAGFEVSVDEPSAASAVPGDQAAAAVDGAWARWVLFAMLASGFASFLYEVLWVRLLAFVVGGTLYAFATMLATFLTGIAIGSWLAARFVPDREGARLGLVIAEAGAAVCALLAFYRVTGLVPDSGALLRPPSMLRAVGAAAMTLLPSALCLGATFPLAVRALAERVSDAAPVAGRVYAWNTIGAVAGAAATGLWLLPGLGFEGTVLVGAAIGFAVAAGFASAAAAWRTPLLATIAAITVGVVLFPPSPPWSLLRASPLGTEKHGDLAFYGVGQGATVLVQELGWDWRLTTNGLPESAIQGRGARLARFGAAHWLTALPIALRPEAKSLFVIGLGAGKMIEDVPRSIAVIDVAELEPEVVAANRALAGQRRKDPLSDPRLRLWIDDARSVLRLSGQTFDIVVSQPSHPWTGGAAHLYTRELFSQVERRLSEDGVFLQWISCQFVDDDLLRSLLATLQSVFPEVEVYAPPPGESLLLLASQRPLDLARAAPGALLSEPALWKSLGIATADDLLLYRILSPDGVRRLSRDARLNTDLQNRLQTRAPWILDQPLGREGCERLMAPFDPMRVSVTRSNVVGLVRRLLGWGDASRARRLLAEAPPSAQRTVAESLVDVAEGRPARARERLWQQLRSTPRETVVLRALLVSEAEQILAGADVPLLRREIAADPPSAAILAGWEAVRAGQARTLRATEDALASVPVDDVLYEAALRLRAAWRLADDEAASAACDLLPVLDQRLAAFGSSLRDVLLRARLGRACGDLDIVVASLHELAEGLAKDRSLAGGEVTLAARRLWEALPAGLKSNPRVASLDRLLR